MNPVGGVPAWLALPPCVVELTDSSVCRPGALGIAHSLLVPRIEVLLWHIPHEAKAGVLVGPGDGTPGLEALPRALPQRLGRSKEADARIQLSPNRGDTLPFLSVFGESLSLFFADLGPKTKKSAATPSWYIACSWEIRPANALRGSLCRHSTRMRRDGHFPGVGDVIQDLLRNTQYSQHVPAEQTAGVQPQRTAADLPSHLHRRACKHVWQLICANSAMAATASAKV